MQHGDINFPARLEVTDQPIDLTHLSDQQEHFYLNLFAEVLDIYEAKKKPRVVIGVAGPTGSGKSVVAVLFKEFAKQASLPFSLESITIDAYHFPNQFLLSHYSNNLPLKMVKGRFDTYDARALARDITAFRSGRTVSFPIYSRKLHDPVKDGIVVVAENTLLILEGLWLLYDQAGWESVGPLLDYSVFIDGDVERAKEAVIKRHMAGGRTREDALKHYEGVDARNSELVLTTKHKADKVIPPYYSIG
jgi:hypothetical protein